MSFKAHDYRYDFEVCCPYNKKHQMPYSKLWYHLSKTCKDQRDKAQFYSVCPYNCLHIVVNQNYENHIQQCRFRCKKMDGNQNSKQNKIFQEMQFVAQQQFSDQLNQSKKESTCEIQQLPNWQDEYENSGELDVQDFKEINEIAAKNYQFESSGSFSSNYSK